MSEIDDYKNILIVDEQVEQSLGTFMLPKLLQLAAFDRVKSISLSEQFMFGNAGREALTKLAWYILNLDHIKAILGE